MKTGSMVMNIIALVLMFPSVICSAICGTAVAMEMDKDGGDTGVGYALFGMLGVWGGLLVGILGSILGFVALSRPKTGIAYAAAVIMILAGLLNISQIMAANAFGIVVGLCYIIAGGLTAGMKPEASQT